MTRRSTRTRTVLFAAALLGTAAAASARVPRFTALPVGPLERPPAQSLAPGSVSAKEHVKGIVLALQPVAEYAPGPPKYAQIFSSQRDAKEFRGRGFTAPGQKNVCFDVMQAFEGGSAGDWPPANTKHPTVMLKSAVPAAARSRGFHMGGVTAVHREELVMAGGHSKLLVTDAWIDPQTLGVRLIGSHTLPLRRVATGPGNVAVYAFRDGHDVHFIVTPPEPPKMARDKQGLVAGVKGMLHLPSSSIGMASMFVSRMTRQLTVSGSDGNMGSSDCGHLRVRLSATPGHGEAATVLARVALPPLGSDDPKTREVRLRSLAIQLSISQTPSESTPALSVSFGWAGREHTQAF